MPIKYMAAKRKQLDWIKRSRIGGKESPPKV